MDVCWLCWLCAPVLFYILFRLVDGWYRAPTLKDLHNRYILVTGADTGFGNAIAKRLDAIGVPVFAGCLTEHGEEDLKEHCSNKLRVIRMDVTKTESISDAVTEITSYLPPGKGLWGVLNNAGIMGDGGPIEWFTQQDYQRVFNVNFFGIINTNNAFVHLVKKAKGRVVNTASIGGRVAANGIPAYIPSKFAVEGYNDVLRRELRRYGVSVSIIEPGFVRTPIASRANIRRGLENSWSRLDQDTKEEYGENFVERYTEYMDGLIKQLGAPTVDGVVNAYEHALLARHPRMRYVVGKDANYVFWPLTVLPDWLGDKLRTLLGFDPPVPSVM